MSTLKQRTASRINGAKNKAVLAESMKDPAYRAKRAVISRQNGIPKMKTDSEAKLIQVYDWLLLGWSRQKIAKSISKLSGWAGVDLKSVHKQAHEQMQNSLEKYREVAIADIVAKYHNLYSIAMEKVNRSQKKADCNALYAAKTILNDLSTLFKVEERIDGTEQAVSRDVLLEQIRNMADKAGFTMDTTAGIIEDGEIIECEQA